MRGGFFLEKGERGILGVRGGGFFGRFVGLFLVGRCLLLGCIWKMRLLRFRILILGLTLVACNSGGLILMLIFLLLGYELSRSNACPLLQKTKYWCGCF